MDTTGWESRMVTYITSARCPPSRTLHVSAKKSPQKTTEKNSPNKSQSDDSLGSESESDMVWGKVVDPSLHEWIVTLQCRRNITDRYFQNPDKRQSEFISSAAVYGRRTYCDL